MYSKYLNRNVNFEYALEYTKNKEEVKEEIKEIKDKKQPIISKPVIKKETKTMVEITGKRVNNRYNNLNNQDTPINVINKEVLIKDVFGYELKEVLKYLYVRMQLSDTKRKAIIAWDNLEVLMNNSIKDKESLKKVINLLTIISDNKLLKIDLDKEKVKKYI